MKIDKVNCFLVLFLSCLIADDGNARVLDETRVCSRARHRILGDNHQKTEFKIRLDDLPVAVRHDYHDRCPTCNSLGISSINVQR